MCYNGRRLRIMRRERFPLHILGRPEPVAKAFRARPNAGAGGCLHNPLGNPVGTEYEIPTDLV